MKVEKINLMQNKLFLVGNTEEDFTKKKKIEAILENRPLLFRENGSGTRQTMERFIVQQDLN